MKITLRKHLLTILAVLSITTIILYSCSDDYTYIKRVKNSNTSDNSGADGDSSEDGQGDLNHGQNDSDNGQEDPDHDHGDSDDEKEKDIFGDLEDDSKEVHQEFTKDELSKIDTNLQDLKITIYANKNRDTSKTRPIIIITKDLFNDAYQQVNNWIADLYKANPDIKNTTAFVVVSGYKSPSSAYQYKKNDEDPEWYDQIVSSYDDLHTLAMKYGRNSRYKKNNDGFINTTDDISTVVNKLIMPNLSAWHMNASDVAAVALGSYATTALLYTIGTSSYKKEISTINGFVPIIAFSAGTPLNSKGGAPNIDYTNIKHIPSNAKADSIKAFSYLRQSTHFLKSYIDNNADDKSLNQYNLLKVFAENKFAQELYFINANTDAGAPSSIINGREFMLRDNVSSSIYGMQLIANNVSYETDNFGNKNGSYYNWPSDNNTMDQVLITLIKTKLIDM